MAERKVGLECVVDTAQDALTVNQLQNRIQVLETNLRQKEEELDKNKRMIKENNIWMKDMLDLWNEFGQSLKQKLPCHYSPGEPKTRPDASTPFDKMENSERLQTVDEKVQDLQKKLNVKEEVLREIVEKHIDDTERHILKQDELENKLQKMTKERDTYLKEKTELFERAKDLEVAIAYPPTKKGKGDLQQELEKFKCLAAKQKGEIDVLYGKQSDLMEKLSQEWSGKISSSERDIENISIKNRPMNIVSEYEALFSTEWLDVKSDLDNHKELTEDKKLTALCEILLMAEETANSKFREAMNSVTENLQLPLCTMFPSPFVMTEAAETQTEDVGVNNSDYSTQAQIHEPSTPMDVDLDNMQQNITDPASTVESTDVSTPPSSGEQDCTNRTETPDQTSHPEIPVTVENTSSSQWETCQYLKQSRSILPANGQTDLQTLTIPKHYEVTLHNTLGDILRLNADEVDLGSLEKTVIQFAQTQFSGGGQDIICQSLSMKRYVIACCRLCWKMAIQRPKMAFLTDGENTSWDSRTQDVFFGAEDPTLENTVVSYYVKPSLVHDDKLMVKGQIMTKLLQRKTDPQHQSHILDVPQP